MTAPRNDQNQLKSILAKPGPSTHDTTDVRYTRCTFDIFDNLLAGAFACSSCLSHPPRLGVYDEPETLSYQIALLGPIGADV